MEATIPMHPRKTAEEMAADFRDSGFPIHSAFVRLVSGKEPKRFTDFLRTFHRDRDHTFTIAPHKIGNKYLIDMEENDRSHDGERPLQLPLSTAAFRRLWPKVVDPKDAVRPKHHVKESPDAFARIVRDHRMGEDKSDLLGDMVRGFEDVPVFPLHLLRTEYANGPDRVGSHILRDYGADSVPRIANVGRFHALVGRHQNKKYVLHWEGQEDVPDHAKEEHRKNRQWERRQSLDQLERARDNLFQWIDKHPDHAVIDPELRRFTNPESHRLYQRHQKAEENFHALLDKQTRSPS